MDKIEDKLNDIEQKLDTIHQLLDILISSLSEESDDEYQYDLDGNLVPPNRSEFQSL